MFGKGGGASYFSSGFNPQDFGGGTHAAGGDWNGGGGNPGGANSYTGTGGDGCGGLLILLVGGDLTIGSTGGVYAKGVAGSFKTSRQDKQFRAWFWWWFNYNMLQRDTYKQWYNKRRRRYIISSR